MVISCAAVMVMDGVIVVLIVGILLWMLLVYGWRGQTDDERYEFVDDDPDDPVPEPP